MGHPAAAKMTYSTYRVVVTRGELCRLLPSTELPVIPPSRLMLRSLSPLTPPSGLKKRACLPAAALAGVLSMQNERTSRVSTNTLERSSRSPRSSPARSSTCPRSWGRNHLVARCLRPTKRNPCDMGYGQSWGAITYHAYQRVADETNVIVSNVLSPGPHGRTAAGPPVPARRTAARR